MMKTLFKLLSPLILASLTSCGFHLRGAADLPSSLSPMTVWGLSEQDIMRRELEQLIGGDGAMEILPSTEGAKSSLRILKRDPRKRVLT